MKEIRIESGDAGQRLDKYLRRYFKEANDGFIYKMLRKKRIKLNGARAEGREILEKEDIIAMYLSDDTIAKFRGIAVEHHEQPLKPEEIVYEDDDILIINKPVGELSQKAKPEDSSINERMLAYLRETGAWKPGDTCTPGICNRLDRNTSGMILAGKTLHGLRLLSELIHDRRIRKFYIAVVEGRFQGNEDETWTHIDGYLSKDERTNRVTIYDEPGEGRDRIQTEYRVLGLENRNGETFSRLEIELITGKTHQIRAHLAHIGHPLAGDRKYGSRLPAPYELQAYRVDFPVDERLNNRLSGKSIFLPQYLEKNADM